MYKNDLASNNFQWLICYKNKINIFLTTVILWDFYLSSVDEYGTIDRK